MENLHAIFSPKSVAVVGASTQPGKVGHDIFVNVLKGEVQGRLYPINPKARAVQCVRAYPSILDVPNPVGRMPFRIFRVFVIGFCRFEVFDHAAR